MQTRQHSSRRARQRGLSFFGLVLWGVAAVAIFAVGGQSFPIWLEYFAVQKAVQKAAVQGQDSTVPEVRAIFDRAATIDDISTISGKDLEVTKNGYKVVVGFSYQREIPLAGPAYLTYKFEGHSK